MFDRSQYSLDRLEEELLAAEPPRKKRRGRKRRQSEEVMAEMQAMLDEDTQQKARRSILYGKNQPSYEEELFNAEPLRDFPSASRGGIRPGLVLAVILEALGLVAVAVWWLL